MRNSLLLNKNCLKAILLSSALAVLAFTGCSNVSGTAENRNLSGNRVAAYLERNQENLLSDPALFIRDVNSAKSELPMLAPGLSSNPRPTGQPYDLNADAYEQ